jgi:GT2 family glycosyltransferase
MSENSPLVYVIILNWNSWSDTIDCLSHIFKLDYSNFKVIVCDNGSTDQSLMRIKVWADNELMKYSSEFHQTSSPDFENSKLKNYIEYTREEAENGGFNTNSSTRLILINNAENLGYAGGNNVGLKYILSKDDFDFAWILNNDTITDPNALKGLINRMISQPNIGMCGSKILYHHDPTKVQAYGGATFNCRTGTTKLIGNYFDANSHVDINSIESQMECVLGASIAVSKSFLLTIGLMSEDYFLYYEEIDWSLRAKGLFELGYASDSIVYHKEGGSAGGGSWSGKQSLLISFYTSRNRLKLMRKFYPHNLPYVYMGLFTSLLGRIYRHQWRNAFIIFLNFIGLDEINKKIFKFV